MRKAVRLGIREAFGFRCGYCGVTESDAGHELTVDHFQPRSRGGTDAIGNLIYCCHACNEFKGDYWRDAGPLLLHPLTEDLSTHIALSQDGTVAPITDRGAFHIDHLHLNRPGLIAHRKLRLRDERATTLHDELVIRLDRVERAVTSLRELILEAVDMIGRRD